MGNIYGYVRVSDRNQNEDRQIIAMQQMEVPKHNIYTDKQSGKDFNRPMYRQLMKKVRPDDVIFIKSIDRLGRNYEEILEQWKVITKEKKVDICVLDMPLLDTRRGKDLMGTFLADIVLALLSYVAENERINIRQRQAEGIAAAKARGVKFGRKPMERPTEFAIMREEWHSGKRSARSAAAQLGVTHRTFMKWVTEDLK